MSVDQLPSGQARSPARDAKLVRYDQYIDTQIASTRRLVKFVDVTTVLITLAAGVLAFLLAAAVVEHWFVPGGFGTLTRSILFIALAGGVGWYAVRRLWPLVVRSINPAYAAYTIEQESPSLKNTLLNLLLFRQQRGEITEAVYETLEQQAAQRLVHVPVESTVDRTHLVRLGYVLVAVVALCALYKIFSPKDPLVTAQRVLLPWSHIVPASRVTITNVEPGTTTLARGETLEVSADVRGIGDDDPVVVRYTTADGQAVDRSVQLAPSAAGLRYGGRVPAASGSETVGVTQNLRYLIEAGDARSREYAVTVVAAPTITVERIDYDYPDYTGYANHTVSGLGDIRAIEGTQVTIHARANEPIEEAAVDFEADGRRDIVMIVDGTQARTPFELTLRDDRVTPKFTSYVLRFTTLDGRQNRDPVKFTIDVLPDYGPEVRILAPSEKVRDVRVDDTVAIEIEARDPDFALANVRVRGDVAGRTVLDQRLLSDEHTGRFAGRLLFTPDDHGLRPGDVLRYWAAASDNRTPQANEVASESQTLRIVSPDPNRKPPQDRLAQRDERRNQQQDGSQQEGWNGQSGGEDAPARSEDEPQDGESADGESASADGEQRQPSDRDAQRSAEDAHQQDSGNAQPSANDDGQPSRDAESQPADGESGGQQNDAGRPGSQSSDQDQQSEDASRRPAAEGGDRPSSGTRRDSGSQEGSQSNDESPVSPDGDNDAEAFERIRRFLERQRESNGQSRERGGEDAPAREQGEPAAAGGERSEDAKRDAEPRDAGSEPGAQTRPGDLDRNETAEQPGRERDDSQSPGGQQTSTKGPSGAGDQPQPDQGSPDSQPDMKPADERQQSPSDRRPTDDQEPPAGGRGKRESDSQGEQGGDHAGGGQEGGGQRAQREGTGSAGQNQSADEGAGESSDQGEGRDSPDAGRDAMADDRTGESSGDERGEGSAVREGHGEQAGGKLEGESADGASASADGDQRQPTGRDAQQDANERDGESSAPDGQPQKPSDSADGRASDGSAGREPQGAGPASATAGTTPEADAANLDYAREQTDLVLETLAEQLRRRKLDKRLLDELGWTPEDMQRFLDRWQQLKDSAHGETPSADTARRQLDEALRSLGLRRGPLQQGPVHEDELRDLREGYRGAVPLEYQERLRAYNEGVSRARQADE